MSVIEQKHDGQIAAGAAAARLDALLVHLTSGLQVVRPEERGAVAELLCGWLEAVSAGAPGFDPYGDIREDAKWWVDIASPAELEAYIGAGLRRIERVQFAQAARKRIFVALWAAMPEVDRRAFVRRVDPHGKFHKGGA